MTRPWTWSAFTGPTSDATPSSSGRVHWPDAARGLCMVLVVLWHSSLWVRDEVYEGPPEPWVNVGLVFTPLRMPLFFFISGYFSARLMSRPLRMARRRTVGLFYLYLVWTGLFLSRLYLPQARTEGPPPTAGQMVTALALPTSFWYLWCLPAYYLISFVLIRWLGPRAAWVLIPLAVVAIFAPLVRPYTAPILQQPMDAVKAPSFLANLLWFFAGTQLNHLWDRLMMAASWRRVAIGLGMFATVWVGAARLGASDEFAWQQVPLAVIALFCAIQVIGQVSMASRPTRLLRRLGQDTLPIYIFHIFLISMISAASKASGLIPLLRNHLPNLSWLLPPVLVIIIIPTTLLIAKVLHATPLAFMIKPPAWLVSPEPRFLSARSEAGGVDRQ